MSYADYLALEEKSEAKHEYLRGEVWAMAGGTVEHARLTAACIAALGGALRGRPCVVYSSDVRVRIAATDCATYPDVTVVCGPAATAPDDAEAIVNPTVLVEVLSDSSEASDRGEKFAHYRHLDSLREYVMVAQIACGAAELVRREASREVWNPLRVPHKKERRIEVFRRLDGGRWTFSEATAGQTIRLASLEIELSVDDLYRNPTAPT